MARPEVLPPVALRAKARRAYEAGRLRRGLVRALPIPLAAWLAMRLGSTPEHVLAVALPLAVAVVLLHWRGGPAGRAVVPGLSVGTAPLLLPGLAMDCAEACSASCALWCRVSCVGGGLLAGALVGLYASRLGSDRIPFALSAAVVATATGAMGCLVGGAVGVAGMLAGFALAAVPVMVLVPRRA